MKQAQIELQVEARGCDLEPKRIYAAVLRGFRTSSGPRKAPEGWSTPKRCRALWSSNALLRLSVIPTDEIRQ